jgi:hypothetical protein
LQHYAVICIPSASERFAGILGHWRRHVKPTVHIPGTHLPGEKIILRSGPDGALEKINLPSPLERQFGCPTDSSYDQLISIDHHSRHSLDAQPSSSDVDRYVYLPVHFANRRKNPVIGVLNSVYPRNHELFALRLLLRRFPARNRERLHSHDGQVC